MARFTITTPIFYVNDVPHIGHAYATLNADAIARWHRLLGDDVFFLTGTDEHGLKIQRAAEEHGVSPIEHADHTSARFREAWALLDISNDDFIRTTEARHHEAVQGLLAAAHENGYVTKGTYEGLYCVSCEAYYTEDELDGENCRIHNRPVEHMKEDNYFFRLSAFEDRLLDWLEGDPGVIVPDGYRREAIGLVKQGLDDISMTRTSIDWGVPVPWDDDHVFYVWYDALINYATAAGYGSDPGHFAEWWPSTHHLIGKDILRFHCVYWPAMLLAAGVTDLPRYFVTGFLLVGGEKMSKTSFNKIAPADLVADFGVDGFRYSMLADHSFGPDGDFSYEGLLGRYNNDLANTFGNLLQRVSTVVHKSCGGIGPAASDTSPLKAKAAEALTEATEAWSRPQPPNALDVSLRLARDANEYLQDTEPWKLEPGPELDAIMGDAIEVLRITAILLSPAIPAAAQTVWERLGLPGDVADQRLPDGAAWGLYPGGLHIVKGDPLFPRLKG